MYAMQKHLFFICPTDHLEIIINDTFKHENYYVTSLGNSISFNANKVEEINALIESKGINEISFVLSDNNCIVVDALEKQNFASINGLSNLYHQIIRQKERTRIIWQTQNIQTSVFSYYLTTKVDELAPQLNKWFINYLKINAKIYNRQKNVFHEVFSDLIYNQNFILN